MESLANPAAAPAPTTTLAVSLFANAASFELMQRQASLLAASTMVPKEYQGNVANCAVALEISARLGMTWFAVMQNLDVIHGRPSWRGVFMNALVASCGRYTPLQFEKKETGPERTVELTIEFWEGYGQSKKKTSRQQKWTYTPTTMVAWAKDRASGEIVRGAPVSYDLALEEGWVAKDGSKWLTAMRELMLHYRAASFFAKIYAADAMFGMQTSEESFDIGPEMRDVTPAAAGPGLGEAMGAQPQAPAKTGRAAAAKSAAEPAASPAAAGAAAPAAAAETTADEVVPPRPDMVSAIKAAMKEGGLTIPQAEGICRVNGLLAADRGLGAASDGELHGVFKRLDLFKPKMGEEPAAEPAAAAPAETTGNPAGSMDEPPGEPAAKPSGPTAQQRKDAALSQIEEQLLGFDGIDMNAFGKMCRDQKLLGGTEALRGIAAERLETIAGSVATIIKDSEGGAA